MTLLRIYIVTIVFLLQLTATAQENTNASFTTANGLPDNNVTCMLTDKQGFIWLGTSNGLCRFDGTHFYTLPKGTFESNKMFGDIILDLEEDGDYIWAAHRFGLSRINKYSFACENFQNDEPGSRYANRRSIRDIFKDSLGNIWLAGDHQLLLFNKQRNLLITMFDLEKTYPSLKGNQVSKVLPAGPNQLLLFIASGWMKYDIKKHTVDTQKVKSIPVKLLRGENIRFRAYWNTFLSNLYVGYNKETKSVTVSNAAAPGNAGRVTNLYVDSSLNIFLNQEQNLFTVLATDKNTPPEETGRESLTTIPNQSFNFIQYSKGICCWGTVNGLHVPDSRSKYFRRYFFKSDIEKKHTSASDILDVGEYSATEWLIATKGGLYLMDKITNHVSSVSKWQDSAIYKTLIMPDKSIWISTNNNLSLYNLHTQTTTKQISLESYAVSIIQFNNKLVVATRSDGFVIVNLNSLQIKRIKSGDSTRQISTNRITAVKQIGATGNFIIGYNNLPGHYSISNFETGFYKQDSIPLKSFALKESFSIHAVETGKKQLWLGTSLGGVQLYDSLSRTWTNITMNDGLANNTVLEIIIDNQNRTWLMSQTGIDVYDNQRRQLYNFPFLSGGKTGGFINSKGKLVFYDKESIVEIDPANFLLKTADRNILLGQLSQGDKQISLQEYSMHSPYNNNFFTISFSLQKLDPSVITKYAYRLSANDNWKETGRETQLNFASLAPGNYKLQIKATDEFNQWKYHSAPFPIVINPPFWKTWWFFLLIFLSAIIATWYIITLTQKRRLKKIQQENEVLRLRTEQELIVAKERERIIADLHDDVGATLSSIHIYSELAGKLVNVRPAESQEMMGKISKQGKDLLGNMSDIIWSLKPAGDEQYSFASRLINYSQELLAAKNIQTHFAIDELLAVRITNPQVRKNILLIAKEAMNNIAKYSNAVTASIVLEKTETMVVLRIEDNGQGFDATKAKHGNGLHNMQQRCRQLGGIFEISSSPVKGTSLSCRFPIAIISSTG